MTCCFCLLVASSRSQRCCLPSPVSVHCQTLAACGLLRTGANWVGQCSQTRNKDCAGAASELGGAGVRQCAEHPDCSAAQLPAARAAGAALAPLWSDVTGFLRPTLPLVFVQLRQRQLLVHVRWRHHCLLSLTCRAEFTAAYKYLHRATALRLVALPPAHSLAPSCVYTSS